MPALTPLRPEVRETADAVITGIVRAIDAATVATAVLMAAAWLVTAALGDATFPVVALAVLLPLAAADLALRSYQDDLRKR